MGFELPSRAQVGYLDPEIAGEGQKVILSDGDQVSWLPPPPKPIMPDWSGIKSIARYFNKTGYVVYPAWLYHKDTAEARLVKNADEAGQLGVCYREATNDERARYGLKSVWDWKDDSPWRPTMSKAPKFDPRNPGQGKTYIASMPNPSVAQNELLRDLVPLVTAAVVQAVKAGGNGAAPAAVDAAQWDEFLKFQAWQNSQAAVEVISEAVGEEAPANALALPPGSPLPRDILEARAVKVGVNVDGRWSNEKLRAEIEKAERIS